MHLSWEFLYSGLVIFVASVIRGYSGFGFAMIAIVTLSFVFPPAQVTPVVLCLEVLASSWLLKKNFRGIDWKGLKIILTGAAFTLPVGVLALVYTPVAPLKMFISGVIIVLCLCLLNRPGGVRYSGSAATFVTGLLSGFLTGVAAIGGPPVILFYYSSNRSVAVSRASMIAFFLLVDFLALVSCLWFGLLNSETVSLSTGLLLPMGLGIWLGNRLFGRMVDEDKFRKGVLTLLLLLACMSLVTTFWVSA